jgi:hypothetical protein
MEPSLSSSSESALNAIDLPHWQQDSDFERYVLSMLGQMILAYEYHSGLFSGLRIFCRMDVSVYCQGNRFFFFLNEFDHSNATGLFSFKDTHGDLHTAFVDLSLTLEYAVKSGFLKKLGLGHTPLPAATK